MANETENAGGNAGEGVYTGPEDKILTLRRPLKLHAADENPVNEIKLTEPNAAQMSKFLKAQQRPGADDVEAGAVFIAENCGVKKDLIMTMGARDFQEALDFLSGFTNPPKPAPAP